MKMPPSDSPSPAFTHTYPMPGGRQSAVGAFEFACPQCHSPLQKISPNQLRCAQDGRNYPRIDGIWRLLGPGRLTYFQQFIQEYETVRKSEGRGSQDAKYYRALPYVDFSGRLSRDWRIRARSYQALIGRFLAPLEKLRNRPLKILDVGAGNCWLSNRLARRGHLVASVDLLTNSADGLGSYIFYNTQFTPVQGEFDCLPFQNAQADLLIFNASLHYSTGFETTLGEAQRVVRPDGQLVILDTPIDHTPDSGRKMVSERERQFS
ncbi:MAG: class I SAM-dependent methyltransferase, partial [Anaerolineales bacterium]